MAPLLLPPVYTHYAAVLLFLFFGTKMLRESREASAGVSDELEEVRCRRRQRRCAPRGALLRKHRTTPHALRHLFALS